MIYYNYNYVRSFILLSILQFDYIKLCYTMRRGGRPLEDAAPTEGPPACACSAWYSIL